MARGIEIHNGQVVLPDVKAGFSIGTRDAHATQTAVMQQVIGVFLDTSADGIGWDIHGFWAWINAAVDRDGDIVGVEGRCYVNEGITVGGHVYGMHSRVYVLAGAGGNGAVVKDLAGIYIFLNAMENATVGGKISAIEIYNIGKVNPTGEFNVIYWKDDGVGTVDSFIRTYIGAVPDINYFLKTQTITSAWSHTGEPTYTAEYGWIKVNIAGQERWILLYDTAPT